MEPSHPCTVKVTAPKIESISVVDGTYPTQLYIGEHIDVSNMKIKVKYSNGKEQMISNGFTLSMTTSLNPNVYDIKVTYKGVSTTIKVRFMDAGVSINASKKELYTGATLQLSATTWPSGQKVTWSSSNTGVATVDGNGLVTGHKAGKANIVAKITLGSTTLSSSPFGITVSEKSVSEVTIAKKPDKTSGYYVGDQINTSGLTLKVKYSDESTAMVESGFTIEPEKVTGTTTTVKVKYGKYAPTFTVKAEELLLKLDIRSKEIIEGESFDVQATTSPKDTTVTWSTDNISVIGINGNGKRCKVTGKTGGQAHVIASIEYGGTKKRVFCNVEVKGKEITDIHASADNSLSSSTNPKYYIGDEIPKSSISVYLKYNDNSPTKHAGTTDFEIWPETFTGTETTVTVSSGSSKTTISVYAKKPTIKFEYSGKQESKQGVYRGVNNLNDMIEVEIVTEPSDGWTFDNWSNTSATSTSIKGNKIVITPNGISDAKSGTLCCNATYKNSNISEEPSIEITVIPVKIKTIDFEYISPTVKDLKDLSNDDFKVTITYSNDNDIVALTTQFTLLVDETSYDEKEGTVEVKVKCGEAESEGKMISVKKQN